MHLRAGLWLAAGPAAAHPRLPPLRSRSVSSDAAPRAFHWSFGACPGAGLSVVKASNSDQSIRAAHSTNADYLAPVSHFEQLQCIFQSPTVNLSSYFHFAAADFHFCINQAEFSNFKQLIQLSTPLAAILIDSM